MEDGGWQTQYAPSFILIFFNRNSLSCDDSTIRSISQSAIRNPPSSILAFPRGLAHP
jgi:hypothetical protein